MSEERKERATTWWIVGGTACAAAALVLLLAWVYLPEIAAFGLRFDATRRASRKTLVLLGPRAVSQVLERYKDFGEADWLVHVRDTCREADADEHKMRALVRSVRDVNARYAKARWTLLHFACHDCCRDLAEALINSGADVNIKDRDGDTPLHLVSSSIYAEPFALDVAALLLVHGADVVIRNEEWETALDLAMRNGNHDIAELLRKHAETQKAQASEERPAGRRNQ